ncbi:MAG: DUF998 domain-containing protein [Candidatus Dojkabacteria bacterium]|nr:DUF998 domain-containing protein [Candidatus Dojkabacteria bacterium]
MKIGKRYLGFIGLLGIILAIAVSRTEHPDFQLFRTSYSILGSYQDNSLAIIFNLGLMISFSLFGIFMLDFLNKNLELKSLSLSMLKVAFLGIIIAGLVPCRPFGILQKTHITAAFISLVLFLLSLVDILPQLFRRNRSLFAMSAALSALFMISAVIDIFVLEDGTENLGLMETAGILCLFFWGSFVGFFYKYKRI